MIESSLIHIPKSMVHNVFSLYLFDHYRYLGRYKLAQLLNISKAQARTLLSKLKEKQLIEKISSRLGHHLSASGREILKDYKQYLKIVFQRIYLGHYTVGKKDTIVCVEATNVDQINTVMLRDEALINGARGCTVFFKHPSDDIFLLNAIYPPLPEKAFSDRKARKKINRLIAGIPWPKFVIIVGTAENVVDAQIGAISAGLLLLPKELLDSLNF